MSARTPRPRSVRFDPGRRSRSVLAKLRSLARAGHLSRDDYAHIQLMEMRARWHDLLSNDRDRRIAAEERAKAILRGAGRAKTKLEAISRTMGWTRVRKRDLTDIAYSYRNLTELEGTVPVVVRSGPRAPHLKRVEACPLKPRDAVQVLRQLYEANSDDAMLQTLHRAKQLPHSPLAGKRLPHRR